MDHCNEKRMTYLQYVFISSMGLRDAINIWSRVGVKGLTSDNRSFSTVLLNISCLNEKTKLCRFFCFFFFCW